MFTRALHRFRDRRWRLLAPVGVSLALVLAPLALMPLPAEATVSTLGPYHPTDGVLDGGSLQTHPTANADTTNYRGAAQGSDTRPTPAGAAAPPQQRPAHMGFCSGPSS